MTAVRMRLVVLGAVALGVGCGDTFVDPFLRDAPPYSLYGDVTADFLPRVHQVRVQNIRATVDPPTDVDAPGADVDGVVRSVDPASGATLVWTPRRVVYDADDTIGTVFEASFLPLPDSRVAMVFTDDQGREVRGEAALPARPPGTVLEPRVVEVDADDIIIRRQVVTWTGERFRPEAVVDYTGVDSVRRPHSIRVVYEVARTDEGAAIVDIDLTRDLQRLAEVTGLDDDDFIAELQVRMDVTALDDALPPADVVPTDDLGRAFIVGGTVGRVRWAPRVKPFDTDQ